MANVQLLHPNQEFQAGDTRALALKEFSGLVLRAFPLATRVFGFGLQHTLTSGKSYQFPAFWKVDPYEHTPGEQVSGSNQPSVEERTVPVDNKQLMASVFLDEVDEFITHYSVRETWATEAANGLAKELDSRATRQIVLGARQAARGASSEFPAGHRQERTGATIAAAYPRSTTGSKRVQEDLAAIAVSMDEADVPTDMRVAWMSPYLYDVLRMDDKIVSRDYDAAGMNNFFTRNIMMVEGFRIVRNNNMPSTNVTTGESAYQGDFSKTAIVCAGHPSAIGTVKYGDIRTDGPTWETTLQAHVMVVKNFCGTKWLRPEACGEIHISG